MKKRTSLCYLILGVGSLLGGEKSRVDEFEFQLDKGSAVSLLSEDGDVTVTGWDKQQARLVITKRVWARDGEKADELLDRLRVDVKHSRGRLDIEEIDVRDNNRFTFSDLFRTRERNYRAGYRIDFELSVPAQIRLEIQNDEGTVEISNLGGVIKLRVDEGDIFLKDLADVDVDVEVDEGDFSCVAVNRGRNQLKVSIDEGSTLVRQCEFETLALASDEGDIVLDEVTLLESCNIQTDEGDIELRTIDLKSGRSRLETDDGRIMILMPESAPVAIFLRTEDGDIDTDFPLKVRRWRDGGKRLEGVLGEGTAKLDAFSEDGDIVLRRSN